MPATRVWTGRPIPDGAGVPGLVLVADSGEILYHNRIAEDLIGEPLPARLGDLPVDSATRASLDAALRDCAGAPVSTELDLPGWPFGPVSLFASAAGDALTALILIPATGQSEADAAAEETTRVVAEVAHELSRPVAAVLNYAEMALYDPDLAGSTRARVEMVLKHAKLCQRVMQEIITKGVFSPTLSEDLNANDLIRDAVKGARDATASFATRIDLDLAPDLPIVVGTADDLTAAIRNLLENAIHAATSATGTPSVVVATEAEAGVVRITVTDSGPGIASDVADSIFEPYVTTKSADRGSGLGLSIVRRIITQHDGRVTAANVPGGGACFTIELPCSPDAIGPPDSLGPAPGDEGRVETCLVVDDDASMRKLLREYLGCLGYEVDEARDGAEALRMSLAREFDLTICDVKMPMMNGAEFFKALREQYPNRAARVIFSTGILPTDKSDAFLRTLPNPRLQKPFRLTALRAAIDAVSLPTTGR